MGFLSKLFGGNKQDKELQDVLSMIHRIIDDEKYQLEFLDPTMKAILEAKPAYDRAPDGTGPFGFTETNPIPVNGPIGQLAYLSRLETQSGQRILFHRLGAINTVDVFEAVTFDGREWFIFFLDLYHPRRSRLVPEGFHVTKRTPQFSGFQNYCKNFPYDFVENKTDKQGSGLSIAYIAIAQIYEQIQSQAFNRPVAHNAKIEFIKSRLTSLQM